MLILGTSFLGDSLACSITPTIINDISTIVLKNGKYDNLYVTKEIESASCSDYDANFDFDTIINATFNNTTSAGNVDWNLSTVSHLLIKRRKENEFEWKTIYVQPINTIEDFNIDGFDYTGASDMNYEYAVVPTLYGIEGNYATAQIYSLFDGMFLFDGNSMYGTILTNCFCDTTRNTPSSTVQTIHGKYPVSIDASVANYDTGTCTGSWIKINEDCEFVLDDNKRVTYQKDIMDFLNNRNPKLLKVADGRMWLVKIEDGVTDNAQGVYNNRQVAFSWTEIGDCNSEEDMYYANLSDVTEEWWNV